MRINLESGSEDWHLWRQKGVGGSDVPAIMGNSPWTTALELWKIKTGRAERPDLSDNFAVQRGIRLEPLARNAYEEKTGVYMQPDHYVYDGEPRFKASLDGITMDGSGLLEIKCPGKAVHEGCARGEVPAHYYDQMQWYLFVTGAKWCDFATFYRNPDDNDYQLNVYQVTPDKTRIEQLVAAASLFLDNIDSDIPPGMSDDDVIDLTEDTQWGVYEQELEKIDKELELVTAHRNQVVELMKKRAEYHSVKGSRYMVSRSMRQGSLDTAKWLKDSGYVVPEEYRKQGTIVRSIRKVKEDTA
jgi:putative phage-type endonuclease